MPKLKNSIKSCFGKKRYHTEDFAQSIAKKFNAKYSVKNRIYHCSVCFGYHITTH